MGRLAGRAEIVGFASRDGERARAAAARWAGTAYAGYESSAARSRRRRGPEPHADRPARRGDARRAGRRQARLQREAARGRRRGGAGDPRRSGRARARARVRAVRDAVPAGRACSRGAGLGRSGHAELGASLGLRRRAALGGLRLRSLAVLLGRRRAAGRHGGLSAGRDRRADRSGRARGRRQLAHARLRSRSPTGPRPGVRVPVEVDDNWQLVLELRGGVPGLGGGELLRPGDRGARARDPRRRGHARAQPARRLRTGAAVRRGRVARDARAARARGRSRSPARRRAARRVRRERRPSPRSRPTARSTCSR